MSDVELEGGCDCGAVRYRLLASPMIVHCCHCRWCQRESGASFALNAMIESSRFERVGVAPEMVLTPSESGAGQLVARCPECRIALWSHYASAGPIIAFVRVGTLDRPDACPPDVHIFVRSKQPWVVLPPDALRFEDYYERDSVWSPQARARREALAPQIAAYQQARRASAGGGWPFVPADAASRRGLTQVS